MRDRLEARRNRRRNNYRRSILVDSKSSIVNFSIDYPLNSSDHNNSVQRFNCIKCKARLLYMSSNNTKCNQCKTNQVEIIQESGEFCLNCSCWAVISSTYERRSLHDWRGCESGCPVTKPTEKSSCYGYYSLLTKYLITRPRRNPSATTIASFPCCSAIALSLSSRFLNCSAC
jgi:hypothetical protein